MIDRFSKQDLLTLVKKQNDPCVTIYLTTEKTGREIYKPATSLKQLAETAQRKLAGHWMGDADAKNFVRPLVELANDEDFWQHADQGLALFLNADRLLRWRVAQPFEENVFVSGQFFVRPILLVVGKIETTYQFFLKAIFYPIRL